MCQCGEDFLNCFTAVFLNLRNFKVVDYSSQNSSASMLTGELWKLKFKHLKVAEIKKPWQTSMSTGQKLLKCKCGYAQNYLLYLE